MAVRYSPFRVVRSIFAVCAGLLTTIAPVRAASDWNMSAASTGDSGILLSQTLSCDQIVHGAVELNDLWNEFILTAPAAESMPTEVLNALANELDATATLYGLAHDCTSALDFILLQQDADNLAAYLRNIAYYEIPSVSSQSAVYPDYVRETMYEMNQRNICSLNPNCGGIRIYNQGY